MSDTETIRQQARVARAQALATLASLDALLATLPAPLEPVEAKRTPPRTLGDDDPSSGDAHG